MSQLLWDVGMFFGGFSVGVLFTAGALLVLRARREAMIEGDRFVERMGPLAARQFLEAVRESPSKG